MESRRSTRIPLPPPTTQPEPAPEPASRKRKAGSPGREPLTAKRAAAVDTNKPLAFAATAAKAASGGGPTGDETWEAVAEATGWTVEECLQQRLTFKKRDDAKAKTAALSTHVKRLRAAGWHLLTQTEKQQLDIEAHKNAAEQEERARGEERARFEAAAQDLTQQLSELKDFSADLQARMEQRGAENDSLAAQLAGVRAQLSEAGAALARSEEAAAHAAERAAEELKRREEEAARLEARLGQAEGQAASMAELHAQAQKYQSQLQEYNTKLQADVAALNEQLAALREEKSQWAEGNAELKGKLAAAEAQVGALTHSEASAREVASEVSRLRGDVASAVAERERLRAELETARDELQRFRSVSGASVDELERERQNRELLESRTKAQSAINAQMQNKLALAQEQRALAEARAEEKGREAARLEARVVELEAGIAEAEEKVREGEKLRRRLHNTILELKGNIRVFCRVRPAASEGEAAALPTGEPVCGFPDAGGVEERGVALAVLHPDRQSVQKYAFQFDRVFAPTAGQAEVFEEISQLVQSALDGYKVCIFAYGQTGSGKTHTMLGRPGDHGMIPRAMEQVFAASAALGEQGWRFEMRACMLEIYNEEYKDLLGKGPPAGKKHQVTHTASGTTVSYLEAADVSKPSKVAALLERAMAQRSVGATAANEHSSRSHFVFMLSINGTHASTGQEVHGMLNLIDLAGSERLSRSLATGDRLKETQNINKSLSALGDVIMALASKEAHVPYRNSKLTYLLQQCLGGDAKTLMFVNIAPTAEAAGESLCSLRFAAKVNACEIGTAKRNVQTRGA